MSLEDGNVCVGEILCTPKQQIYILIRIKMDIRLWTIHEGESNENLQYFYLLIY